MKKFSFIISMAAAILTAATSCDSDSNEPFEGTTVTTTVENPNQVSGIGLSKKMLVFDDDWLWRNRPVDEFIDTVEVENSDWILSHIDFSDSYSFSVTAYAADLSGQSSFEERFDWLDVKFEDGKLYLHADTDYWPERLTDTRSAELIFQFGEEGAGDTLKCVQHVANYCGYAIQIQPTHAHFPARGGSCRFTMPYELFCFQYIKFGNITTGKNIFIQNPNDIAPIEVKPFEPFSTTIDYVTINRYSPYEFTVAVEPNETGAPREFHIFLNDGVDAQWIDFYQEGY